MTEHEPTTSDNSLQRAIYYLDRRQSYINTHRDQASLNHVNRLGQLGRRFRSLRQILEFSQQTIAQRLDIDPMLVLVFEAGIVSPEDLPPNFPDTYHDLLESELQAKGIAVPPYKPFNSENPAIH